jgi:hypothetical protein
VTTTARWKNKTKQNKTNLQGTQVDKTLHNPTTTTTTTLDLSLSLYLYLFVK